MNSKPYKTSLYCIAIMWVSMIGAFARTVHAEQYRLSTFSADVTIPLGHRCMGLLRTKSQKIVDPLRVYGFVLHSSDKPIVLAAFDWCEIRNGAYDALRDAFAKAAGTERQRVIVTALHQHDAPVVDREAQLLLDSVGLSNELHNTAFLDDTIERVSQAVRDSMDHSQPISHIGYGMAKVEKVASRRRVREADGRITHTRGSTGGGNKHYAAAPDGDIDPFVRTIAFYNGNKPVLAIHSYATHPMSYYGRGGVTWDFVGIARERLRREQRDIEHIYLSGCSGDVTAGKYNDGSPDNRQILADRLYTGMKKAFDSIKPQPLTQIDFRSIPFHLEYNQKPEYKRAILTEQLENKDLDIIKRIAAAMSLSSLNRVEQKHPIDMACIDFGHGKVVLFPGETFVGYQLMAQQLLPDNFVFSIGFGESWPGYIPMKRDYADGFNGHSWSWVSEKATDQLPAALKKALGIK